MKKFGLVTLGTTFLSVALIVVGSPLRGPVPALATVPTTVPDTLTNSVIQTVCVRCHNDERLRGNMSLASFDADTPLENHALAEKIITKLRAGMMPPPGTRRPEEAVLTGMAEELEARIDAVSLTHPKPGTRTFQRLNRAEYARAVRGMLDIDVDSVAHTQFLKGVV